MVLSWRCTYQAHTRTKNNLRQASGPFFGSSMKRREYCFYFPLDASGLLVLNSLELIYTLYNFFFVDVSRVYKRQDFVDILIN